ncbi:MAG: hypothetical protein MZW92_63350 [Comamonadaceae bacterium]|nr:hypothetical protein [Comamonadaceae bacterium]
MRFDHGGATRTAATAIASWVDAELCLFRRRRASRAGSFTARPASSPTNGITVRACWDVIDFAVDTCPNAVTNTLTVASEALSVNIRTNELIQEGSARLTYIKQFVVMVVDAAGQAKPDVVITPSVDLPAYFKGYYTWTGENWDAWWTARSENYQWVPRGASAVVACAEPYRPAELCQRGRQPERRARGSVYDRMPPTAGTSTCSNGSRT